MRLANSTVVAPQGMSLHINSDKRQRAERRSSKALRIDVVVVDGSVIKVDPFPDRHKGVGTMAVGNGPSTSGRATMGAGSAPRALIQRSVGARPKHT